MVKENHLLNHFLNPAFHNNLGPIQWPYFRSGRLTPIYMGFPGGWQRIARLIAESAGSVMWFPDANVAFIEESSPAWNTLRTAALGTKTGSAAVTPVTSAEMRDWLSNPFHHRERADAISESLQRADGWIRRSTVRDDFPGYAAILGYSHLLGVRRSLARPTAGGGRTLLGTDPAAKCETMNAIRNQIGPRAQGLAKKGRIDAETHGVIKIDDELNCMLVFAEALVTAHECAILTTDPDLIEIFSKAQWFLDTHYRAWLAGEMIADGGYGEPAREVSDETGLFEGPITLYRRHTMHLREVLPIHFTPVRVHLVYVSAEGQIHHLAFTLEREMLGMLETRARTGGRCTDQFGNANIHVDLGPIKNSLDGLYLGIGRDLFHDMTVNGEKVLISRLDRIHSLTCYETVGV